MRSIWATLAAAALVAYLAAGAAAGADTYTVRPGDTLTAVAARVGVDARRLATVNGIVDSDHIRAGQVLTVSPASYQVRPGDTLWALAPRLGVAEAGLVTANSLRNPDMIFAGRTLLVPASLVSHSQGPVNASWAAAPPGSAGPVTATRAVPAPTPAGTPGPALVTVRRPWTCPVPGARFVDDFGYVKPDGTVHQGVDVFAPPKTPVLAPVAGMVAPYPNPMGGKAFQLFGDDGNRYYGAHLDAYGRTGRVAAGTVIGYVGNTGDAMGGPTHVHFELHPGGGTTAANPFPLLRDACR
ncbi:MAG: LysM peptidoglycan-binding domain-containing protein [Acidimicrobiales bacterium]